MFDVDDAGGTGDIVVGLSAAEAMTVVAALRQYEPFWSSSSSPHQVAEQLATVRDHIVGVIAKVQAAAGR